MKLPKLPYTSTNTLTKAEIFGGLNKTDTYVFGELSDCKNITSDNYPALASRKERFVAPVIGKGKVLGCGSSEEFYYVYNDVVSETAEDGTVSEKRISYFVYGGKVKGEWEDSDAKEKSFAEIGRYICIYPDLMYFRREDTEGRAEYEKTMSTEVYNVGTDYERNEIDGGYAKIENTLDRGLKIKYKSKLPVDFTGRSIKICNYEGGKSNALNISESEVLKVAECNAELSNDSDYPYLMSFDGWFLKATSSNHFMLRIQEVVPEEYCERFGSLKAKAASSGPIDSARSYNYKKENGLLDFEEGALFDVVDGIYKGRYTLGKIEAYEGTGLENGIYKYRTITADGEEPKDCDIELSYPDIKGACSSNNRIWAFDSDTIYASALGNPKKFYGYGGTAADSWTVDVISNGEFVKVFEYAGMPHFAKKDRIIKIYGTTPSTYQTSELLCDGVIDSKSVAMGQGCMYWLSENGIMRYTGAYPVKVSEKLGKGIVSGIGSSGGSKYYIYAGHLDGKNILYVYDAEKGLWHSEDCESITSAANHDGKIYAMTENGITVLYGSGLLTDEEKKKYGFRREAVFDSYAVLSDNYENTFYHKYVSKLIFRLQASDEAHIRFYLRYDNDEMKTLYYEYIGNGERDNIYIPIVPRRCDRYELYIEGTGNWKIISMARELSGGSTKKNIER